MKYLLDTNICVFFIRGKYNLYTIFKEKGIEIVLYRNLQYLN